jgi:putative transposase
VNWSTKSTFEYDVTYESKRSYYDLFDAAGISWKKTTSLNPKADPEAVSAKKKRLKHCGGIAPRGNRNRIFESITA